MLNDLPNAILSFKKALSLRGKPEIRTKPEKTILAANKAHIKDGESELPGMLMDFSCSIGGAAGNKEAGHSHLRFVFKTNTSDE